MIHFSGDTKSAKKASIRYTTYSEFAKGHKVIRMNKIQSPVKYSAREIVERAKGRVGERRYHLIDNNCEHFVRWCRFGGDASEHDELLGCGLGP
jgi:hypothetical protein